MNTADAFQSTLGSQIVQDSKYHLNLGQDVIVTTEDRFRLCLLSHRDRVLAKSAWVGPVSLCVTIALVLLTSTFRDFMFPAATWHAIFVLGCAASLVWSIVAVVNAWRADADLDTFIAEIKSHAERGSSAVVPKQQQA